MLRTPKFKETLLYTFFEPLVQQVKMQGAVRSFLSHGNVVKTAVLQQIRVANPHMRPAMLSRFSTSASSVNMEEHGFESTTIDDILKAKGKSADGSWLWCTTEDTVYDAVQSVCFLLRVFFFFFFSSSSSSLNIFISFLYFNENFISC